MKICVINIATNGYEEFLPELYDSIDKYFLTDHEVSKLLFTDSDFDGADKTVHIDAEPWPYPTLKRYHYFCLEEKYLSEFDYCFYFDADMKVLQYIGEVVLGDDITATMHPLQSRLKYPCLFSYHRDKGSTARVHELEGTNYYCGGFNGGTSSAWLEMSRTIKDRVNEDSKNGIIARWHDESHLNRYLIDHPPSLILGIEYCYTDDDSINWKRRPRILAVRKDEKWDYKKIQK